MSIERIHARTLKYIGYVLTLVAAVAAVVGWVGYLNLKHLVVLTTTRVTEEQVKERLSSALTTDAIDKGVKAAITGETRAGLQSAIEAEVSPAVTTEVERQKPAIEQAVLARTTAIVNGLAPQIKRDADEAIKQRLNGRSLTAAQESIFENNLKQRFLGTSNKEIEIHTGTSAEQQNFAGQLRGVFQRAGWKATEGPLDASRHGTGIALGVMDSRERPETSDIQKSFASVDITCPKIEVHDTDFNNDNHTGHSILLVLPNIR